MRLIDIYRKPAFEKPNWHHDMRALLATYQVMWPGDGAKVEADSDIALDDAITAVETVAPFAYRVQFGKNTFSFPGGEMRRADHYPAELSRTFKELMIERDMLPPPGICHTVGTIDKFGFPAGVVLITGKGDSGKTPTSHALAEQLSVDHPDGFYLLRLSEPFTGNLKTDRQAGLELAGAMASHSVIVIDSIKDLLTTMGGTAMESGLSRDALPMLSRMSMLASDLGCVILCPINPSSPRDSVIELIAEAARSNVATAMIGDTNGWTVIARRGEGMMRRKGTAELEFKAGLPVIRITSTSSVAEEEVERMLQATAFSSVLDANYGNLGLAAKRLSRES